ncbi:MAG TPA: S41 family peptidase [Rhodothermales bacterium]|nr:S41 family peptidase [Rhodothermales bacterium]
MRPVYLFLLILLYLSSRAHGVALAQEPEVDRLTSGVRTEIIEAIASQLRQGYVYEDRGIALAGDLLAAHSTGRFDSPDIPVDLAEVLTNFLQDRSRDRHLRVSAVRRPRTGASPDPGIVQTPQGVFDRDRPLLRFELMPGNVGYVAIGPFGWTEAGRAQVDSVMNALRNVDALILDVGRSPGGGPDAVVYLSSLLFDEPTHLVSSIRRGWDQPMDRWTRTDVAGPRFPDIPVIVLTSSRSFSAAESFAFGLVVTGRARIIGERTGGGGHFGELVSLPAGLSLFLPVGRTYDPKTGMGWEADGLDPEIEIPYEQALPAALAVLSQNGLVIPSTEPPDRLEARRELLDAERALLDAYERRDVQALELLLDSGYAAVYPGGRASNRSQTLSMVGEMVGAPPARHRTEGTEVLLYGDAAVLTGVYVQERGDRKRRARYDDVWIYRDGAWKIVSSRLQDE